MMAAHKRRIRLASSNRISRNLISLGELQSKVKMLEVACHWCERRGRVSPAVKQEHEALKALVESPKLLASRNAGRHHAFDIFDLWRDTLNQCTR